MISLPTPLLYLLFSFYGVEPDLQSLSFNGHFLFTSFDLCQFHCRLVHVPVGYRMPALRHVHSVLPDDTAKSSELDYCNSLLYSTPKTPVDMLQHAQNVLALVLTPSGSC